MSIRDLEASQHPLETQQLVAQFRIVEQKLKDQTPGIVEAMIDIHKNLLSHEELVAFLTDEDLQMLHKAHEKHKQFVLIQVTTKQTKKAGKKLNNDDLNNL